MQSTPAIHKLTQAMLNGGKVTRDGITKRVLVSTPNSGDWYVITMTDAPKARTFTARREDARTAHVLTGEDFSTWAQRLERAVSA
jgi:uncharacterized RmlC-like cupin family protein